MDVNWNPSHDSEACCRVYRFGQTKPVYIYRLVSTDTMEDKVHRRQLHKEVLSSWVIDDGSSSVLDNLVKTKDLYTIPEVTTNTPPEVDENIHDSIIGQLVVQYPQWIARVDLHDHLLGVNDPSTVLTEEEKRLAEGEEVFDTVYKQHRQRAKNTLIRPPKPKLPVARLDVMTLMETQRQTIEKQNNDEMDLLRRLKENEQEKPCSPFASKAPSINTDVSANPAMPFNRRAAWIDLEMVPQNTEPEYPTEENQHTLLEKEKRKMEERLAHKSRNRKSEKQQSQMIENEKKSYHQQNHRKPPICGQQLNPTHKDQYRDNSYHNSYKEYDNRKGSSSKDTYFEERRGTKRQNSSCNTPSYKQRRM
jgi:hypothetical protein